MFLWYYRRFSTM